MRHVGGTLNPAAASHRARRGASNEAPLCATKTGAMVGGGGMAAPADDAAPACCCCCCAPAAAVDADGTVHVVYSTAVAGSGPSSSLVYVRTDGETGWTEPAAIAPSDTAGFQMMSSLTVDDEGVAHVIWRDQRQASEDLRAAHPANGDLFASDLRDGAWSEPRLVLPRPDDTVVVGWPHLAVSGDRLVAVWSVSSRTGEDAMGNPTAVLWASRPLADAAAEWSEAAPVLTDGEGDIGGRLIDLARDREGNLALVSGDFGKGVNALSLYRLDAGADSWSSPEPVSTGDYGYMPSAVFDDEGGLVVVFNSGRNRNVEIGALRIDPDGAAGQPVSVSPAEEGLEARAAVAISAGGAIWVAYMHQPDSNSPATELRVLRGADISAGQ